MNKLIIIVILTLSVLGIVIFQQNYFTQKLQVLGNSSSNDKKIGPQKEAIQDDDSIFVYPFTVDSYCQTLEDVLENDNVPDSTNFCQQTLINANQSFDCPEFSSEAFIYIDDNTEIQLIFSDTNENLNFIGNWQNFSIGAKYSNIDSDWALYSYECSRFDWGNDDEYLQELCSGRTNTSYVITKVNLNTWDIQNSCSFVIDFDANFNTTVLSNPSQLNQKNNALKWSFFKSIKQRFQPCINIYYDIKNAYNDVEELYEEATELIDQIEDMVDNCGEALDSDGIDLWSDSKCAYHIYKTYEVIKEGYETLENALQAISSYETDYQGCKSAF